MLPPRYLFLATRYNGRGQHPYSRNGLADRLKALGELMDIRDSQDRRPALGNLHRFRHTRATNLINANVPVHVVQRYLGHLSPRMTMHYSKTLRETHEREFLRFKKITAEGTELQLDPCSRCSSSTNVPTASCPTACACCPPNRSVTAATRA